MYAVKAIRVTESWGRAGQPDWVKTHGIVTIPWGALTDFIQPAAHSKISLVDCAGRTYCAHTHTHLQAALVSLCSPSWYKRRHKYIKTLHTMASYYRLIILQKHKNEKCSIKFNFLVYHFSCSTTTVQ